MIGKMIERVAILTGLPEAPPPDKIRVVSLAMLYRYTRVYRAKAAYLKHGRQIIHAKGYEAWVPHELTHMLQVDHGQDPKTAENEKQAQWVQNVYWKLWPKESDEEPTS